MSACICEKSPLSFSLSLSLARLLYAWHNKCSSVLLLLLAVAIPFGAIPVGRRFWVVCMHAMDVKFFFSFWLEFFFIVVAAAAAIAGVVFVVVVFVIVGSFDG